MKVIILKDIPKLGKKNEIVEVSDGYALNYLFPKKLAERATDSKISNLEKNREMQQKKREEQDELLKKELEKLNGSTISISEKANAQGNLFKGVNTGRITQALTDEGYKNIEAQNIILKDPIKEAGIHTIKIEAAGENAEFTLNIEGIK